MPDNPAKDDSQPQETVIEVKEEINSTDILDNNEEIQNDQSLPPNKSLSEEVEKQDDSSSPVVSIPKRRYRRINRPLYYIGGNNGTYIVDDYLASLGWERIADKTREDYRLKWCEIKSHNNYHSFREGEQLCYQIPNNKVLTTKIGLLTSLQEYDRVMFKVKKGRPRIMKYQDFFPETYRLDLREERDMFCDMYIDNEMWISKPTGLNQGKGIYLIRNRDDILKFQEKMADIEEDVTNTRKLPFKIPMARIVQRYITNPLLLDGKKFDVRNYMLISSTMPFVVFYCDGYCRLTCLPYDERSTDMTGHLTNQFMQKKNPLYQEVKDETVWSMDRFNEYVNKHHLEKNKLPQDWVHTVLRKRCQQIMLHCFQSVRHKLECKLGFFDLYGCDFLVDDNFKISLLEFNCNPALHTNCGLLKEVIPTIVTETIKLAMETFSKAKNKERIMPLASQEKFVLLYNGDLIEAEERREKLRSAAEARRRAQSAQRKKKLILNYNVRIPFQNRKESDGEGESGTLSAVTNNLTNNANSPTTSSNVQSRYLNVPQNNDSTPVQPTITSVQSNWTRSQTSLSAAAAVYTHSPPRVTQSRSMPNVSQKKPFYAGGSVPSRPFSAPRFQRNKLTENRSKDASQEKNANTSPTEENIVTEASVAASLDAKIKIYKRLNLSNTRTNVETKEKVSQKQIRNTNLRREPNQNAVSKSTNRQNERTSDVAMIHEEEDECSGSECPDEMESSDDNEEEQYRPSADHRKIFDAMSASVAAMQAPSAKLPQYYHSKVSADSDFSKRYLAGFATAKKGQNKIMKVNGTMKVYKTPLPSALTYPPREITYLESASEPLTQQQKVQYRTPTTVRVRQTLQATTCTLEIGPKLRRGLVAIPTTASPVPLVQSKRPHNTKNNSTKLRMMNASGTTGSSPIAELEAENGSLPGIRISLEDPILLPTQIIQQQPADDNLENSIPAAPANSPEQKVNHRVTSVDSSTQTPVSNSALTSEEKVIWRLRTRIGANSNNVRFPNRLPIPSNEHINNKSSSSTALPSTVNSTKMHTLLSPRYVAIRPTLTTGVTLAICPPALISGKNMLPSIQETKNNFEMNSNIAAQSAGNSPRTSESNQQLSRHSQTQSMDLDYDLPTGATVRTILDGVARAKFENRSSEKWMTAG